MENFIFCRVPIPSGWINPFYPNVPFLNIWSQKSLEIHRNQSTDLQSKSMDLFLYNRDFFHKRVKHRNTYFFGSFNMFNTRTKSYIW